MSYRKSSVVSGGVIKCIKNHTCSKKGREESDSQLCSGNYRVEEMRLRKSALRKEQHLLVLQIRSQRITRQLYGTKTTKKIALRMKRLRCAFITGKYLHTVRFVSPRVWLLTQYLVMKKGILTIIENCFFNFFCLTICIPWLFFCGFANFDLYKMSTDKNLPFRSHSKSQYD